MVLDVCVTTTMHIYRASDILYRLSCWPLHSIQFHKAFHTNQIIWYQTLSWLVESFFIPRIICFKEKSKAQITVSTISNIYYICIQKLCNTGKLDQLFNNEYLIRIERTIVFKFGFRCNTKTMSMEQNYSWTNWNVIQFQSLIEHPKLNELNIMKYVDWIFSMTDNDHCYHFSEFRLWNVSNDFPFFVALMKKYLNW